MQQKQEFFQNFTEQKVSVCGMESVENIFQNITEQERSEMMRCFQAAEKRYVAGNIISTYQRDNQKIGILQEGRRIWSGFTRTEDRRSWKICMPETSSARR